MQIAFPLIVGFNLYKSHLNLVLTWRKENRLKVLENAVLRKIFGKKRDEVRGELGRLHITHNPHQILFGMGWTCGASGIEDRCTQAFSVET
jgi:hypothetical protein